MNSNFSNSSTPTPQGTSPSQNPANSLFLPSQPLLHPNVHTGVNYPPSYVPASPPWIPPCINPYTNNIYPVPYPYNLNPYYPALVNPLYNPIPVGLGPPAFPGLILNPRPPVLLNGPPSAYNPLLPLKRSREVVNFDDDEELETSQTPSEEVKAEEAPLIASLNFLFNYIELKNAAQEVPCTLSLQGMDISLDEIQKNRQGIDLVCVIDISGSMVGEKIQLVKETLEFLLTVLDRRDRMSLCVFNNSGKRLTKLVTLNDKGKSIISKALRRIQAVGGTNIASGMQLAYNVLNSRRFINHITSIFLLTDGLDNTNPAASITIKGLSDSFQIKSPTIIHTFGYGRDHDALLMQDIAKNSKGNFYFVEFPKSIPDAFANCLGELVSLIANNITVKLETQACAVPFTLSKVFSENGDRDFTMPPVFAGSKKDTVFMLRFDSNEAKINATIRPIKAKISYETKNKEKRYLECELEVNVVTDGKDEIEINEDVMVNFYRAKGAEILRAISRLAEERRLDEAKRLAEAGAQELKNSIVKQNPVIAALIKDLDDAKARVASTQAWEMGGRAQVVSLFGNYQNQNAASNTMVFQNCQQAAFSSQASSYFGKR
ncbi:unnamed protein product [Blepharisma stoltei]|uniref:VWFA domain-containing protein n=1 Tax=Blepharisma stoltei TaxID=1481888 RepID=A0AAU9KFY0_9CILI|nr:unnamed protein product [Blepharisma stoltei]